MPAYIQASMKRGVEERSSGLFVVCTRRRPGLELRRSASQGEQAATGTWSPLNEPHETFIGRRQSEDNLFVFLSQPVWL